MKALAPDTLAAVMRYGPSVDALARRRYRISGPALLAKLVQGESGDSMGAVSSADARGKGQFIPSTRKAVLDQFGIDPWRSTDEAVHAAALHLRGKVTGADGLEGYNPGGGRGYVDYILGQKVGDVRGAAGTADYSSSGPAVGGAPESAGTGLTDLLRAMSQPAPAPQSAGLAAPAFAARPALPAGYAGVQSPGVQAPEQPNVDQVLALVKGLRGAGSADGQAPSSGTGVTGGTAGPGRGGRVTIAKGANKPGTDLAPELVGFLERASGYAGLPLTVGTGTEHSALTVNGRPSDHADGHAADIPVPKDSRRGDAVAAGALMAVGVPRKQALRMAATGGLWTINRGGVRVQVIWKTDEGGNHHDHVHVGFRPTGRR